MNDPKKKSIAYIKTIKPRSNGHKILSNDPYVGGFISKVEYIDDEEQVIQWVILTKKHSGHADNESQLIQQMNVAFNESNRKNDWIYRVFNIGGFIALILVATVAYLFVVKGVSDIPESLKTILLTIVGFYFGGLVNQRKKPDEKP